MEAAIRSNPSFGSAASLPGGRVAVVGGLERFYHVLLDSDSHRRGLFGVLGLESEGVVNVVPLLKGRRMPHDWTVIVVNELTLTQWTRRDG